MELRKFYTISEECLYVAPDIEQGFEYNIKTNQNIFEIFLKVYQFLNYKIELILNFCEDNLSVKDGFDF